MVGDEQKSRLMNGGDGGINKSGAWGRNTKAIKEHDWPTQHNEHSSASKDSKQICAFARYISQYN